MRETHTKHNNKDYKQAHRECDKFCEQGIQIGNNRSPLFREG